MIRQLFRRKPKRQPLAPLSPLAMRNALMSGAIVPCRTSPTYLADMRSTIAGTALLMMIALVVLVMVVIAMGASGKFN